MFYSYFDQNELVEALGNIRYIGGTTNTADGIQLMNEEIFQEANGDRPGVPNIAVVLTDGQVNLVLILFSTFINMF